VGNPTRKESEIWQALTEHMGVLSSWRRVRDDTAWHVSRHSGGRSGRGRHMEERKRQLLSARGWTTHPQVTLQTVPSSMATRELLKFLTYPPRSTSVARHWWPAPLNGTIASQWYDRSRGRCPLESATRNANARTEDGTMPLADTESLRYLRLNRRLEVTRFPRGMR